MDIGHFRSSRVRFWMWILLPLALIALAGVPSQIYASRMRASLAERQELRGAIPLLDAAVRRADDILAGVTPDTSAEASARDGAARRLDDAAKQVGLVVRSVKVSEEIGDEASYRTIKISVQVQGSMRAVVQWLAQVQKPGLLITVSTGGIMSLGTPPDDTVAGDFTFVLHVRKT